MSFRKSISTRLVRIAHYLDPESVLESDTTLVKSEPLRDATSEAVAIKREDEATLRTDQSYTTSTSDSSLSSELLSRLPQQTPTDALWFVSPIPVGVSINMIQEGTEESDARPTDPLGPIPTTKTTESEALPPSKKPRVRNEGCDHLAERYNFEADKHAEFDEPTHKYTVHGKAVHRSVTGLVHSLFEPFNGNLIVSKHYANWKERDDPRYKPFIEQATDDSGSVDDEQAKRLIVQSWTNEGKKASDLGTKMHLYAEQVLNWNEADGTPRPTPHDDVSVEGVQFDAFMASDFVKERELEPIRTELTVFYMRGGVVVTAGQIDALFHSKKTHQYYIIDWKRIKPDKRIDAAARAFRNGLGFASSIPDTQHYQYSLQTSIYSLMLRESHGIDAEDNLYLVRMHADRSQGYELVKCTDLRPLAHQVLTHEYMNLTNQAMA